MKLKTIFKETLNLTQPINSLKRNKTDSIKKKRFLTKLIIIFIYLIFYFYNLYNPKDNTKIPIKINGKGFLKINTFHKSKFSYYNYTDNVLVYKDLYKNISYVPINKISAIKESIQISKENYFQLCENQTLLDNTKYKRNNKPKISVIIPFYNKGQFSLYTPLRSIQNQSFKDLEIIFVDDGSSEKIINQLIEEMKNDNRIILIKHKRRKGTLMSRVDGVRFASGEYIITMDQDDLFINNLLFEQLYKKAKEQYADIVQFSTLVYENKNNFHIMRVVLPRNVLITQPELKIAFFPKLNEKRFDRCKIGMIWDKFVKRETYLEAIEDLGDEYLNHIFFAYEDTLMAFELSQIAFSYFYYDIKGYRYNKYLAGQSRKFQSDKRKILAMNQLYFVKLLLYKVDPLYDRYHIYKELGFKGCGSEVIYLDKNEIDLLYEILEVIIKLERLLKNTVKELLACTNKIKIHFSII